VDSPPTTATTNTPMRRTVAITAVTALVVVGQLYAPIPLLTDIGTQLHVSAATAAWVSAIFGFGYAIGMLVAGPLSDTLGRRRIVVAGLVAAAITTGIVALAPTFPVLLISRALQGGAAAFFPPVALAYLTERIAPAQRTMRSEEHTSELQSRFDLVCRLLLEKKKTQPTSRRRGTTPKARASPGSRRRTRTRTGAASADRRPTPKDGAASDRARRAGTAPRRSL